jgi:hypothetical protein
MKQSTKHGVPDAVAKRKLKAKAGSSANNTGLQGDEKIGGKGDSGRQVAGCQIERAAARRSGISPGSHKRPNCPIRGNVVGQSAVVLPRRRHASPARPG